MLIPGRIVGLKTRAVYKMITARQVIYFLYNKFLEGFLKSNPLNLILTFI